MFRITYCRLDLNSFQLCLYSQMMCIMGRDDESAINSTLLAVYNNCPNQLTVELDLYLMFTVDCCC